MFGRTTENGVTHSLLLDCTLCYLLFVFLILMLGPKYLANADKSRAHNFGVSDKHNLGIFAGVMPFTVAAIVAVFVPLSARHGMLSPKK